MTGRDRRVVVIGAGIGGLSAAALLAAKGCDVTLCEAAAAPGGKVAETRLGELRFDTGPALLTGRATFEAIFREAGGDLGAALSLSPVTTLGRHAWPDGTMLDLTLDAASNADAIGKRFGAAEARGYRDFSARAGRVHAALDRAFLSNPRPTPLGMAAELGFARLIGLSPFATLGDALATHFRDPRLIQLFGRYATYVGAAPALAPATLMLVAAVEREGLWRVAGGMPRLAEAMAALAERQGARIRTATPVRRVETEGGRASGVTLESGERLAADAVVANADLAAIAAGRLGDAVRRAVPEVPLRRRSHSAIAWAVAGRVTGREALHTNIVFPDPRAGEHAEIALRGRIPAASTLELGLPARHEGAPDGVEPILIRMCAPARGDGPALPVAEMLRLTETRFAQLAAAGFEIRPEEDRIEMTTPADHERRFPGTGGALYGPAMQGWNAAFERPRAATPLPGFFLAGAGAHPGAGLAMAALSGRFAAAAVLGARA
jgi:1-hydroxycarotenoid 3,4-desaturase